LPDNFKIILSRTDSIGDVVLTLPMAGLIKKYFPACTIYFLGRNYTRDVISLSEHVDEFVNYDDLENLNLKERITCLKKINADVFVHVFPKKEIAVLAKKAGTSLRVGTANRHYHWLNCNQLIKLSRKNSDLHEAQLNFKLLSFLNINTIVTTEEITGHYGFSKKPELKKEFQSLIDKDKFNLILHPKSKGSAREWGLFNFKNLYYALPKTKYKVFVSGTKEDAEQLKDWLKEEPDLIDICGVMDLKTFISFIGACDGLVAASTGPLHIAAALGKTTIGLFAPMRPIHPARWKPLGLKAHSLVLDKNCNECRNGTTCRCIQQINAQQVVNLLPVK